MRHAHTLVIALTLALASPLTAAETRAQTARQDFLQECLMGATSSGERNHCYWEHHLRRSSAGR